MRFILLCFIQCFVITAYAADIKVAAATNLRFVIPELITEYEQQQPQHRVLTSFSASGTLTTQIIHGAPFDLFLSASPDYVERLRQAGYIEGDAITYAYAQLALFSLTGSGIKLTADLSSLTAAKESNTLKKVVIANPMHAPYGQLAKQQLELHGLWDDIQSHLLVAESASQALQFSLSPQASVGFIPYSYTLQDKVASKGRAIKLDVSLEQQAVMIKGAQPVASHFLDFLQSEQAQSILLKHGFKGVR